MPSTDYLIPFALATLLFAYMPGPALLYTVAQTLASGKRGGFMAAFGIHIGCYLHVIAATLGLSAFFIHVPEAYVVVKTLGAMYLIWLGFNVIRAKGADLDALPHLRKKSRARAFGESMLVEILNPKVALFFIAFLPQFVDPAAGLPIWAQFLILGTIVNFAFSSADVVAVLSTSLILKKLKESVGMQRITRWIGGSILMGLGVKLALTER
ncbi:MAG: LysE family translocator [Alphaproteobacteria bacterium]|nr:LysE family translocator [Alphaproteobacteria bacterium]